MFIAVLTKAVPDTYADREFDTETGLLRRADLVLDEISERALEAALTIAEKHPGAAVAVVSMGPEAAAASLRRGLAMGASSAMHIIDDALIGADVATTAEVLRAALAPLAPDLIIAGDRSTDGSGGVLSAMLAELLGLPSLTSVDSLIVTGSDVTAQRATESGRITVTAKLPAVVSVTEQMPDPRFPGLKETMSAKRKPFTTITMADLDLDARRSQSILLGVRRSPRRSADTIRIEGAGAGAALAKHMTERGWI